MPDQEAFSWLTGEVKPPQDYDTDLLREVRYSLRKCGSIAALQFTPAASKSGVGRPTFGVKIFVTRPGLIDPARRWLWPMLEFSRFGLENERLKP